MGQSVGTPSTTVRAVLEYRNSSIPPQAPYVYARVQAYTCLSDELMNYYFYYTKCLSP